MLVRSALALCLSLVATGSTGTEMKGHGGPVRALAVLAGDVSAVSGSFDQSAIVWDLRTGEATTVLRFHDGAVNAVAALPAGFVTGGEDGRVAIWAIGSERPVAVVPAHQGPIVGLSVSADGRRTVSASWDGTARVANLDGSGTEKRLAGHQGPVNAAVFGADGRVVTAGYDGTVRIWPEGDGAPVVRAGAGPVNALAIGPGAIYAGGADGTLRVLGPEGEPKAEVDLGSGPILALATSPDGERVAAALLGGAVALLDGPKLALATRLVGPGLPVWSLSFTSDGREVLTGGSDRLVRRWDARTGEHIGAVVMTRPADLLAVAGEERGAEVFKACAACHTLTRAGGNRAGPSLHGVFGRRIATLEGYNFSPALKALDIVWSADTIGRLFEVGPARYTPGTKMPEQTVSTEDREALIRFLERATRPAP